MSIEGMLEFVAWKVLWNPFLPTLLLGIGLYLTIGMRFFQVRRFGTIMKHTIGSIFKKKKGEGPVFVSSFEAFATALGGSVGSGNIAGVASAVALGGPGALFWMWVAALVGMATKMGEIMLAQHYKERYEDGTSYGGASFYMEKGIVLERGMKWFKILAFIFSLSMVGSFFFGVGTYTVCESVQKTFSLTKGATIGFAFLYTALLYVVILGGIPRIVKFATFIVPGMTLLYLAGGLGVIFTHIPETTVVIGQVFQYALTPHAAVGGFAGVAVMKAIQVGVARSVYSNEAGWGSSPMIHAAAEVKHPGFQGLWGAFEVFVDTIVICSITALTVLVTGVWQTGEGGAGSVGVAFDMVYGHTGMYLLSLALFLFQVTTTTGWYTYLETILVYFNRKKTREQRLKVIKVIRLIGPAMSLMIAVYAFKINLVPAILWILMDIQTAVPIYINMFALLILSPVIFKLCREFEDKFLTPAGSIPRDQQPVAGR